MELNQLAAEEQIALVALLEFVIESDGRVSEDEADRIDAVVAAIGEDAYRRAAAEVDRRFEGEDGLRAFLPTITRQAARDLIYGIVLEAATSDAVDAHESEMLEWVASVWRISTQLDESEP
ncbi:MAG: TerB family tellurite resistance protein [Acidobacteriia bacterium]|nr:TerB family tellurite resistance protein [Terriglobia bacterium]